MRNYTTPLPSPKHEPGPMRQSSGRIYNYGLGPRTWYRLEHINCSHHVEQFHPPSQQHRQLWVLRSHPLVFITKVLQDSALRPAEVNFGSSIGMPNRIETNVASRHEIVTLTT